MTDRFLKDIAASVRQRLLNLSRERSDEFQLVLTHYAIERLLYRLSKSEHRGRFAVKGAMLLSVWIGRRYRTTRDLDLSGRGVRSPDQIVSVMHGICGQEVEADGLWFDADSVAAEPIREDQEYDGVRVTLLGRLQNARIPLQIDIGFGDAVVPREEELTYPTLLEFAAPQLKACPKESVISEKFQAMVSLGAANSRMKDFYDTWMLARTFDFEGPVLRRAIKATFERRRTEIPTRAPYALSEEFFRDDRKNTQWKAFQARGRLVEQPTGLGEVVAVVKDFVLPPAQAAAAGNEFAKRWKAGGPWS